VLTPPEVAGIDPVAALQCAGESAYLAGDYEAAVVELNAAYDKTSTLASETGMLPIVFPNTLRLRAAAAAQAAGQVERARDLYTLVAANTGEGPTTVAAAAGKLGEMALDAGDDAAAVGWYDLVLAIVERTDDSYWASSAENVLLAQTMIKRAHGNRGVARLRLAQTDPASTPDCAGPSGVLCRAAQDDFAAALVVDPLDPITLLNAGWAARVLGDDARARLNLTLATTVDPTLFPALNDLGVLAAQDGDMAAARRAFEASQAAEPDYDLAAWNLGVLELQRGLPGLLPGQAWLQRALSLTPSFRSHDFALKTDERVYRVTFGGDIRLEHGWSFGRAYSLAAVGLGTVTVVATLAASLRPLLLGEFSSTVTDHFPSRLARGGNYLRAGLRRRLSQPLWRRWRIWEPWLLTLPVLAVVTAWPAWRSNPTIGVAAAIGALFAAAVAIAAHELGHALAARMANSRLVPAQWGPGVGLALLLLPLQLSSGPFLGQRVLGVSADRAWWVYLAGPAGNLLVAVAAYGVFLTHPLPLLRLITEAQLAAIGYALLPFAPLDGSVLKSRPLLLVAFGLAVAITGVLFTQGMG
jgi:tetratricopeptide (TPR) repeat protein